MSGSAITRRSKFDRLLLGTAGVTPVVAMLAAPQPGVAAVLPTANTVGVCSGVSLPKSTITNLVTPIVQAGIQPIENTTNSILHTGALSTLLGALSGTTLNVDLSSTVAAVSAGQPITLQVLADNGSVLGPQSTCYARADGVTLSNSAGIAIGGNVISGLGDTAQPAASAGDINSIAFGNKATSDALAKGSVAIGTNSTIGTLGAGAVAIGNATTVAALNGVALGNAAQVNGLGGVALGSGASASAANSVAIGAGATASRGGSAYTGYALTVPTLSSGEVSVGATGATRQLTNLAPGLAGTDAVNVDQLTAVNTQVAATASTVSTLGATVTKNTADIATNVGDIAGLKTSVTKNTTDIATNVADIAGLKTGVTKNTADIATNVTDIAGLKTSVTKNTTDIATNVGDIAGLKTGVTKNTTDIATNVTDIAGLKTSVTKNTTDIATNVTDIAGLKTGVTKNTADIATNVGDIAGLKTSVTKNTTDIATNVTDIAGLKTSVTKNMTDIATNVGDIASLKTNVTKNTADIATNVADIAGLKTNVSRNTTDIATNVGDIAGLKTNVSRNTADIATNVGDIAGLKVNVARNGSDIATNTGDIATLRTGIDRNTVDIATNVTDIAGLRTDVTKNTTDIGANTASIDAVVTRVTANESDIAGLDTRVKANADDIATVDARVTRNTADIALNTTGLGVLRNDVSNGAIGPVRYSDHATPTTPNGGVPSDDVTLVGASGTAVGLHNVASGTVSATSTDAVNGSQLYALESLIPGDGGLGVAYDDATRGHVTLGGVQAATRVGLSNLADATLADGSSDAVTGSQLFATNQQVGTLGRTVTGLSTTVADHGGRLDTLDVETAANTGAIGAVGGRMTTAELNIASLNGRITVNTDAIDAMGGRMTTAETRITGVDTRVATNTGDIATLDTKVAANSDAITTVDARITGVSTRVTANSDAISSLDARVTTVSNSVVSLDARFGAFSAAVSNGGVGPVRYSDAATPTVPNGGTPSNDLTLVGAAAAPVRLHNVAAGDVSATSTDAINGSQLFAVASAVTGDSGLAVAYDDATRSHVTLGGARATAPVGLSNLADGLIAPGSSDAVTGNQLDATSTRIATVGGDVDRLSGVVTGLGGTITTVTNSVTALGDRYTSLDRRFAGFADDVADGAVGPVRYSDAATPTIANGGTPSQDLTLVGAGTGTVGLHNLTDGRVAIGSSDAVTGGQLAAIGAAVAGTLGGVAYDPATNSFAGNYTYLGTHYTTIQAALDAIGPSTTGTVGGFGIKYFHTNSTEDDSRATGSNATAIGAEAVASGDRAVAMGNNAQATGASAVAIGDGAMAQDGKAVSIGVGNLASGDGAVSIGDPNNAIGDGSVALGKDNDASGTGAIALGNVNDATGDGAVSLGSGNAANGAGAVALGAANSATGIGAIAIGSNNVVAGDGSLALGSRVVTSAVDTLAVGTSASATAASAMAIGNRSSATGANAVAVGVDSSATRELSSAYGQSAQARDIYATAIGAQTSANGIASTAIGTGAAVDAFAGTAIGTGAMVDHENSVALGAAVETTRGALANYAAFGLATAQTSNGEIAIAQNMTYTDPRTGQPSTTGARQITGVAAGSMATDAVNVAQLRGVSDTIGSAVASGFGGGAAYDAATGRVTGGSYTVSGVTYGNVGDALQALASRGTGTGTSAGGVSASDPGAVHYDNATGGTITLASGGTLVSNVAAGGLTAGSSDAVNGSQLAATNARVDATGTAVAALASRVDNGAAGVVQYASAAAPTASNGGTRSNDATLVGADATAPVALHNVASGSVASGSTDAVNGGQLAVTNARVATVEATANSALASAQGSVQYDDATHGTMTLGGGGAAAPVAVRNVADGTAAHDAVNVGQLVSTADATLGQAEAYTDRQVGRLAFDLGRVKKDQAAGTAGALALSGMPQPYEAGRGMVSMGFGTFMGQTAMAVGLSKAMSDEHTVVKLGATYNSRGNLGANAGVGYQF